jgi:hypothetical protein
MPLSPMCGPHSHHSLHSLPRVGRTSHRRVDPAKADPIHHTQEAYLWAACKILTVGGMRNPLPHRIDLNTHNSSKFTHSSRGISVISHIEENNPVASHFVGSASHFLPPPNPTPPPPHPATRASPAVGPRLRIPAFNGISAASRSPPTSLDCFSADHHTVAYSRVTPLPLRHLKQSLRTSTSVG